MSTDDAQLLICAGRGSTRAAIAERLPDSGLTTIGSPPSPIQRFGSLQLPDRRRAALCSANGTDRECEVGRHVVIMPNVTLTHDDQLDDFATICAGVTLGGSVHVGGRRIWA